MDKTLVIVESPAKGSTIQDILGDKYQVISSYGHIVDLTSGGKYGIGINIKDNFKPYYSVMEKKMQVIDDIINAASKSSNVLLCADNDREGERIASDISNIIKSTGKPIKRVIFNEITEKGIKNGINNPRDIDMNIVKSQETRRVLDRIVGYLISPFLSKMYGFGNSGGRVQSVAARLIVDREEEINTFKPEEYWNGFVNFITKSNETFSSKLNIKVKNKEEAGIIKNKILSTTKFIVEKVEAIEKKVGPNLPLITSSLQQVMAKKYGFEPDKTMKVAQSLYEAGMITYMRTDSIRISDEAQKEVRKWLKENNYTIPKIMKKQKIKSNVQNAHECIRPTHTDKLPNKMNLMPDEKQVYKEIWRYFAASQMDQAIYSHLEVIIRSKEHKDIIFKSSGKALKYKGHLHLFGIDDKEKIDIPSLNKNDELNCVKDSLKLEQQFTKPPPRYNDATLVKFLEIKGIGRPSTYAEIIKKITARKYVIKENNIYKPTELGIKISDLLKEYFDFMQYSFTADIEKDMDLIEEGNKEYLEVLQKFYKVFEKQLKEVHIKNGGEICEKCGSIIVQKLNKSTNDIFFSCIAYPYCYNIKNIIKEVA